MTAGPNGSRSSGMALYDASIMPHLIFHWPFAFVNTENECSSTRMKLTDSCFPIRRIVGCVRNRNKSLQI
ncbi:hypothetical protein OUZ56_030299 [Daphnia magna]|uniref:Uncharacterized protein n=1 Tax=Daphnia magna TaxID=35525 RepID=A0ABQ9ZQV7_9CRUS|nr:hypothetical protein OUZ56_030299 [Daphnia magna]